MKIMMPYVCTLIVIILVVPIFSSTNFNTVDASNTEMTDVLILIQENINELLSDLHITIIEEYDNFILAEITAIQKELLTRYGVEPLK